jgi:hypothetical protein
MIHAFAVILLKQFGENNNRITDKKVGNMLRKKLVDSWSEPLVNNAKNKKLAMLSELTILAHAIIKLLVYWERIIVVLGTVHPSLGDVQVHAIIPRFRNLHSVLFKGLNEVAQSARRSTNIVADPMPSGLAPPRCGHLHFQR